MNVIAFLDLRIRFSEDTGSYFRMSSRSSQWKDLPLYVLRGSRPIRSVQEPATAPSREPGFLSDGRLQPAGLHSLSGSDPALNSGRVQLSSVPRGRTTSQMFGGRDRPRLGRPADVSEIKPRRGTGSHSGPFTLGVWCFISHLSGFVGWGW